MAGEGVLAVKACEITKATFSLQKWPVPCMLGAFVGWTLGQLATLGMCSILWLARAGSQKRISRGELDTKTE